MSYFKDIQLALDTQLNSLTGGIAIAWENTEYTPVKDTPYLRPTILMAPASLFTLAGDQENEGIYQIDLFYPASDGMGTILTKIDAIYDHFKASTTLTSGSVEVHILEIGRASASTIDNGWLMASMEIHFKVYEN